MWSGRYEETIPLYSGTFLDISESGKDQKETKIEEKKMTCIHGSEYTGRTCDCTKCRESNSFSLQLDMAKQYKNSAVKNAFGGGRNIRYGMWFAGREIEHSLDSHDNKNGNGQVKVIKSKYHFKKYITDYYQQHVFESVKVNYVLTIFSFYRIRINAC